MVTRNIEIERRIKELKEIVERFNLEVINYSDCFHSISGTLVESEAAGDIDQETVDFYMKQVSEIIRYMPGPTDLEDFLFEFKYKTVEPTTREEAVAKNLVDLRELVNNISNDLANIDSIDDCLCPNDDKDIMDYLTPEQWNERQQIMNSLEWHICMEFPWLIKEEELKRHNIKY